MKKTVEIQPDVEIQPNLVWWRIYSHSHKKYYRHCVKPDDGFNLDGPYEAMWFDSRARAIEWLAKNHPLATFGDTTFEEVPIQDVLDDREAAAAGSFFSRI